jgi:hypothetical protein
MDFNVCKNPKITSIVKVTVNGTTKDIPACPSTEKFIIESSTETLKIWAEDATPPGTKWVFQYKPIAPQSVNVTIGGDE